jgi:hypothetical protein
MATSKKTKSNPKPATNVVPFARPSGVVDTEIAQTHRELTAMQKHHDALKAYRLSREVEDADDEQEVLDNP